MERGYKQRIAAFQDAIYSGTDTLYEDLLAWKLEGRHDVDVWYHDKPYRDLINSMYRDTDAVRHADLKAYCKAWYPAMSAAPWHDGHLRMTDTDGDYFGYWTFEAGAVAYLLDLDDSSIDHMVYPKDLVRFARELDTSKTADAQTSAERIRIPTGQPCARDGRWFTPAGVNSRRRFAVGDLMPELGGEMARQSGSARSSNRHVVRCRSRRSDCARPRTKQTFRRSGPARQYIAGCSR